VVLVHQFFGCFLYGPSICLGDGIMLCMGCLCWVRCWCGNCVRVSGVVVCDTLIHICSERCVSVL